MIGLIRVALIDDHPLFREGLINTLTGAGEIDVVGQGATAADALRIAREQAPDIVLLDVGITGGGIESAAELASTHPNMRIIMLTVSDDEQHVVSALRAGAWGYILKGSSGREIVEAVRAVAGGASYVTPNLAARLLSKNSDRIEVVAEDGLTAREKQIFASVARGMSNREIAEAFNCTERTVKNHMTNIMQKLKVRNRVEVALKFQLEDV